MTSVKHFPAVPLICCTIIILYRLNDAIKNCCLKDYLNFLSHFLITQDTSRYIKQAPKKSKPQKYLHHKKWNRDNSIRFVLLKNKKSEVTTFGRVAVPPGYTALFL